MLISSTKKAQSRVVQGNELRGRPLLVWGQAVWKARKLVGKSLDLRTSVTLVDTRAGWWWDISGLAVYTRRGSQGCLENTQYKFWAPQVDVQYILEQLVREESGKI